MKIMRLVVTEKTYPGVGVGRKDGDLSSRETDDGYCCMRPLYCRTEHVSRGSAVAGFQSNGVGEDSGSLLGFTCDFLLWYRCVGVDRLAP